MAWTFEDKFNSDTKTTGDLNGQDGWSGDIDYDIVNTVAYEGNQCVQQTSSNGSMDYTLGTDVASGILYVAIRANSTMISSDDSTFRLVDASANTRVLVGWHSTTIKYGSSSVLTTLVSSPVALRWYLIEIELLVGGNYKLRYHDGNAWSSQTASLPPYTGSGGDVHIVKLNSGASGGTSWFDCITPTNPIGTHADVKNTGLATSLTSYWELEESSGTRNDSHGTNHLTDNNTVLSGTGKQGTCADFESTNSEYLSITDASQTGLDNLTNATFAFWVNLESDTDPIILGKFATGSQSYWIQVQLTGIMKFQDSTETDTCQISVADMTLSTWYYWVITYEAGVVKLYVDGKYLGTDNTTNTSLPNTTGYFSLGRIEKYNSNYLDGLLDEVGVWSRALTQLEVTNLYNAGAGIPYDAASSSGPANLKSYNTNLKANIKSINTNPIANVKSLNTNV